MRSTAGGPSAPRAITGADATGRPDGGAAAGPAARPAPQQQVVIHKDTFRDALTRFPSGVTIVTTVDGDGRRWGFTASAFSSLSLDPPLVLVCLDRRADCHPAFCASQAFAVNILAVHHAGLAQRFASKGADKFASGRFSDGELGLPVIPDAVAALECRTTQVLPGGDHTILIGEVNAVRVGRTTPMVYYGRQFGRVDLDHRDARDGWRPVPADWW